MNHKQKVKKARKMFRPVYVTDADGKIITKPNGRKVRAKGIGIFGTPGWEAHREAVAKKVAKTEAAAKKRAADRKKEVAKNV